MEIRVLFLVILLVSIWLIVSSKGRKYIAKTAKLISNTYVGMLTGGN